MIHLFLRNTKNILIFLKAKIFQNSPILKQQMITNDYFCFIISRLTRLIMRSYNEKAFKFVQIKPF